MATTRHPAARAIWIANAPKRPAPTMATVSPKARFACRRPCMAMAPMVVSAAASVPTLSGMCTARLRGT